jgi:uncharacterized protein
VKVVLDTNVLLAGVATHGLCESVVALTLRDHKLLLSDYILSEFEEHYVDKFKATTEQASAAAKTLRSQSQIVEPRSVLPDVCDDLDDLPVLGTAEAAQAEYLVTGDQGLLQIGNYKGTSIVTPRDFYDLIRDRA